MTCQYIFKKGQRKGQQCTRRATTPDSTCRSHCKPPIVGTIVGDYCTICLDSGNDLISCCRNGHVFHQTCITTWLRNKRTCPICRQRVTLTSSPLTSSHPVQTGQSVTTGDRSPQVNIEVINDNITIFVRDLSEAGLIEQNYIRNFILRCKDIVEPLLSRPHTETVDLVYVKIMTVLLYLESY